MALLEEIGLVDADIGQRSRWRSEHEGVVQTEDRLGDHLVAELRNAARVSTGSRMLDVVRDLWWELRVYEEESRVLLKLAWTGSTIHALEKCGRMLDSCPDFFSFPEGSTWASWRDELENERNERVEFFQKLLGNETELNEAIGDDEQQHVEIATLLSHGYQANGDVLTPLELDVISVMYDQVVRKSGVMVGSLPKWFVAPNELHIADHQGSAFVATSPVPGSLITQQQKREKRPADSEEACLRASAIWSSLHHPNVRRFYGACHVGQPFFVHEWVEPLTARQRGSWECIRGWALGLQYLHKRGLVFQIPAPKLLLYDHFVGNGLLSGLGLVLLLKPHDADNQAKRCQHHSSLQPSVAADVSAFALAIVDARAIAHELRNPVIVDENKNPRLPSERPAFISGNEWALLVQMCAADPTTRADVLYVVQQLGELAEQDETLKPVNEPRRHPSDTVANVRDYPIYGDHSLEYVWDDIKQFCGNPAEISDVDAQVYNRLADVYSQLVSPSKMAPPVLLVERFGEIVWDFFLRLEKAMSLFNVYSGADDTVAGKNYHFHGSIDRLLASFPVLDRSASIHSWCTEDPTTRSSQRDTIDSSFNDSPELSCSPDEAATIPTWFMSSSEVQLGASIAEGSFGVVHHAKWFDADVVAKKVKKLAASFDSKQVRQEADIWFMLNHPNVVKLYGACHTDTPFFVCEYAARGTLSAFLKGANRWQVWGALHQAALGLQFLHNCHVVHGDLKGNNILVDEHGVVKLTDFGLSSFTTFDSSELNATSQGALGAFRWKAPECLAGSGPTFASDVYSFAMCIIEVVSGKSPWGNAMPEDAVKLSVLQGNMPNRPEMFRNDEWELVLRMCCLNPSERVSIDAVVHILKEFKYLENGGVMATVDRLGQHLAAGMHETGRMLEGDRRIDFGVKLWQELEKYENETRLLVKLASTGRILYLIERYRCAVEAWLAVFRIPNTFDRISWQQELQRERDDRLAFFENFLEDDWRLADETQSEEQQLEVLTLLKYDLKTYENKFTASERDIISKAYDSVTRRFGVVVATLPEWFTPSMESTGLDRERDSTETVANCEEECLREAAVWSSLRHPHVQRLFAACHTGHPFFVHEWGQPLVRSPLTDSPLAVWQYLHGCALGLYYVHEQGLMYMHTDLRDDTQLRRRFVIEGFMSGMHLCSRGALHPSEHVNDWPGDDDSGSGGASSGRTRVSDSTGGNEIDEDKCKSEGHTPEKPSDAFARLVSPDVVAFGLGIFEILAHVRGANVKSQEVSSQTKIPQLPAVQPDFLNKDEWDLLVGMCAADPAQRTNLDMYEIVYNLEKLSKDEKNVQTSTITASSQGPEPVVDIKLYIGQVHQWTIAEHLRELERLIDEAPDAAAVNRLVCNRLADIYEQLVVAAQFLPLELVKDFSFLLLRFYDQLEKPMWDDLSVESFSRTTAFRNNGVHYDIDRLILSTPVLQRTASIHSWKLSWKQAQMQEWLDSSSLLTEQNQLVTTSGVAERRKIDPAEWFIPVFQVEADECIAAGGFGHVYQGKWLGADVAIKQIMADQSDEENRAHFRHELDLWFPLDHPHIIKLYGACSEDQPFFVSELASKGTLVSFLKVKQRLDLWRSLYGAALGLQYLHKRGIVHADLKGNNILVCEDGTVKLSDFGLSVFANRVEPFAGSETGILGAVRWKAPECLNGAAPTFASDVYSFGMCIIEAITGEFPWGKSISDLAVKHLVTREKLPRRPESFSDAEWEFVTLMCAFDPQKRITVDTIVDLLSNFDIESKVIVDTGDIFARTLRALQIGDKSLRNPAPVLVASSMPTRLGTT